MKFLSDTKSFRRRRKQNRSWRRKQEMKGKKFNKRQKRRTDGINQQMQTDVEQEKTLAKNRHQYIKTDITEKQN